MVVDGNPAIVNRMFNAWKSHFQHQPDIIVKSPGRINLIGEHTDYNNGYVLPAAINLSIYACFSKNHTTNNYQVVAADKNESFQFTPKEQVPFPHHSWKNYVLGVVQELLKKGCPIAGFNVLFSGDIPIGAGLSSSAALENSIVYGLNELFDLQLSKMDMIYIAQKAEHHYAGVQCGIMDPFSSMMGKKNQLLLIDCNDLSYTYHNIDVSNYEIILIHSNVQHELASSEYNLRRQQCESAVKKIRTIYPFISSLRDITEPMLTDAKGVLNSEEIKRCMFVFEENKRVLSAIEMMEQNRMEELENIVFKSHDGLKNLYEVTCPETDFLVEFAKQNDAMLGARQMGGGFGGCTLNLVKKGCNIDNIINSLSDRYNKLFKKSLHAIPVSIEDGVHTIHKI